MTKLYLAAGVAALAIAVPATAGPGGHGGGPQHAQTTPQKAAKAAPQQRAARTQPMRAQRAMSAPREQHIARQAQRAERASVRPARVEQVQAQKQVRAERIQPRQQQARVDRSTRVQARQQVQANRMAAVQDRRVARQQMQVNRAQAVENRIATRQQAQINARGAGYGVGGCPPGLASKGCMPPGQAAKMGMTPVITASNLAAYRNSLAMAPLPMALTTRSTPVLPLGQVAQYVGQPYSTVNGLLGLSAMPASAQYLYPDTSNYYYQYGNGYAYQVDRGSSLISALIPLLAGGYMPGQYLPSSYMNSYTPDYYGLNSFYPASSQYGGCNRYMNGVVYQVDCVTGMVENVVPTYASGYGVGQMIPSAYSNYNLPYEYRSMYPASADNGYWYAPGAIYQYDRSSSLITSVASLLSPGLTVGQSLPMGYGAYNVPYGYRDTYADTSNAWYRYNNGNIYQVDPTTQLVSAVVASILT
ncbi:MAG: hypothetical protein ABIO80_08565 [Sphingomicrobium sp.]